MAVPASDPGTNWGLIEWLVTTAWAVLVVIGGVLARIFTTLYRRIDKLEKDSLEAGHQLKGVKQVAVASELLADKRHKENREDRIEDRSAIADLREFIGDEFRSVGQRVDALLRRKEDH